MYCDLVFKFCFTKSLTVFVLGHDILRHVICLSGITTMVTVGSLNAFCFDWLNSFNP